MGKRNPGQKRANSSSASEGEKPQYHSKWLKEKSDHSSGEEVKLPRPTPKKSEFILWLERLIRTHIIAINEFKLGSQIGEPKQLKDEIFEYQFSSFEIMSKKNRSITKVESGFHYWFDD